jgi:hypothetical protein
MGAGNGLMPYTIFAAGVSGEAEATTQEKPAACV